MLIFKKNIKSRSNYWLSSAINMIDGFLSIGVFLVLFGVAFELIIGITEQLRGERNQAGRLADLSGRTRFDRPSRRYKRIQVSREELQEIKARLASEAKLL